MAAKAKQAAPAAGPSLDEATLAAQYGWGMALLNSDPSLKDLFHRAVSGTWAPDKFAAELKSTSWYQNQGEAARNAQVLRTTDPATWNQKVANQVANISVLGNQMGAVLNEGLIRQMAENSLQFGWNDNNLRQALGQYVTFSSGQMFGQAAQFENDLRSYAASMGVRISDESIGQYVRTAVSGGGSIDGAKGAIQNMAEAAMPHLRERFQNGETLAQIAEPYKQSMANLLEINPSEVTLFDPAVRSALGSKNKDGQPELKSVWEFENQVREDPRWAKTKNAQDAAMSTVGKVLTDWGIR